MNISSTNKSTLVSLLLSCGILSCGSPDVRQDEEHGTERGANGEDSERNAENISAEADEWQYDIVIPQIRGVNVHPAYFHDSPYTVFFVPQIHFHPFGSTSRELVEITQLDILSLLEDIEADYGINHFGEEGNEFSDYKSCFDFFRGVFIHAADMSDREITNFLYFLMQDAPQLFNRTIGQFTASGMYQCLSPEENFFGLENDDFDIVSETHLNLVMDHLGLRAEMRDAFIEYMQCVIDDLDDLQDGSYPECAEERERYSAVKSNYTASMNINNDFFYNLIIDQRNISWAENIASYMQREDAHTVVVVGGSMHRWLCDYIEEHTVNGMHMSCISLIVSSIAQEYWNLDLSDLSNVF